MNANLTITYSISHILFKYVYFTVIFFCTFKMKNWDNEMVRKDTCKHDTTNDSCCVYSYFVGTM